MASSTTIIGGGVGGLTLAVELRKRGFDGEITIIDPDGLPYDKPPLSKEALVGTSSREDILLQPATWYEANDVSIVENAVTRIDAEARQLHLADGTSRLYDNLVLATGGLARRGATPGFDSDDVTVLRTMADADKLRSQLHDGAVLGVIGAGLVGAEVASSARSLGADVILIDPAPVSLVPAVGEELAQRLHDLHEENGVRFVQGLTTGVSRQGEKLTIDVDGSESVTVDAVLLCIGIIPEEALATSAELECDGGVLVDHDHRTTDANIWAIGDCARVRNKDGSLERRHEHWDSAVQEAVIAAASITGTERPVQSPSWFWSDRYGVHVEGVGSMTEDGETVIRPDDQGRPAVAFRVTPDGKLSGAASIDDSMAIRASRRIIERDISVDPEKLADPSIPVKKLAR